MMPTIRAGEKVDEQERLSEQARRQNKDAWDALHEKHDGDRDAMMFDALEQIRELTRQLTEAQEQLQRLLILNDYGYEIGHHSEGPKSGTNGEPFLSDEWLEQWYGKHWAPDYVHEALKTKTRV